MIWASALCFGSKMPPMTPGWATSTGSSSHESMKFIQSSPVAHVRGMYPWFDSVDCADSCFFKAGEFGFVLNFCLLHCETLTPILNNGQNNCSLLFCFARVQCWPPTVLNWYYQVLFLGKKVKAYLWLAGASVEKRDIGTVSVSYEFIPIKYIITYRPSNGSESYPISYYVSLR